MNWRSILQVHPTGNLTVCPLLNRAPESLFALKPQLAVVNILCFEYRIEPKRNDRTAPIGPL
jgi:hypothetical protein